MSAENVPFGQRSSKRETEEGSVFAPLFDKDGLIPTITTDAATGDVLMFAYMNEGSLRKTLETGEAWYWSRSRDELWHKGATSGQVQTIVEIRTDCDQDVLLLRVTVGGNGGACHVGYRSCFYRSVETDADGPPSLRHNDLKKL